MLNMHTANTTAESSWNNGVIKHHNAILTDKVIKVKEDIKCSLNDALALAICQKCLS